MESTAPLVRSGRRGRKGRPVRQGFLELRLKARKARLGLPALLVRSARRGQRGRPVETASTVVTG